MGLFLFGVICGDGDCEDLFELDDIERDRARCSSFLILLLCLLLLLPLPIRVERAASRSRFLYGFRNVGWVRSKCLAKSQRHLYVKEQIKHLNGLLVECDAACFCNSVGQRPTKSHFMHFKGLCGSLRFHSSFCWATFVFLGGLLLLNSRWYSL